MASGLHELIPRWQRMVESHYKRLKDERDLFAADLASAEEAFMEANEELMAYKESNARRKAKTRGVATCESISSKQPRPY